MQDDVKRRSGPFQGNGQTTNFPFGFYVFSDNDVSVVTSDSDSVVTTVLEKDVDYTVTINADQDATAGGTVKLVKALPAGKSLALTSNLAYTQEMQLTNFSRFPPEILNDAMDRTVILIQQLKEMAERHITVPSTSSKTPEQLLEEILDVAANANVYAQQAKAFLDQAIILDKNVTSNANSVSLMKSSVDASEQNVTALAAQVNDYSDELMVVAENLDAIRTVDNNEEVISTLAADLGGYPIVEFDGGEIDEPNTSMNGVGGVMKVCADNIEVIKQVAESLKNSAALMNLAETVDEIGSTDYVQIDNTGNAGA